MPLLPIDTVLPALLDAVAVGERCILQAEPGAGKTTRVPLALLQQSFLQGQKIIMLEPRRIAARGAAEFMAAQLGERCGDTVGYRMRQENAVSANTRLEVVTEGVFLRMLQEDPGLEGVGLVIFDEFHERNIDSDVALTLCLKSAEWFREDNPLRLLVMSATLDVGPLQQYLDCPVIASEGRSFPVDVVYHTAALERRDMVEAVVAQIRYALQEHQGSILVFLSGQADIQQAQALLQARFAEDQNLIIAPLYGNLSMADQRRAVQPPATGQRKIVLATNIAESSLTIEGVDIVIDTGWAHVARFDSRNGMSRIHHQRISQASAKQRAGRAGRIGPGVCYRMWTEQQHHQLIPHDAPAIVHADLTATALQLVAWGCGDINELSWLEAPPQNAYQRALQLLRDLGALKDLQLTRHGQRMADLPCHPRLAHMLLRGNEWGAGLLAAQLAALLEERDPLRHVGADLETRLSWLREGKGQAARIQARAAQLFKALGGSSENTQVSTAVLLAQAYPDRVAQLRKTGGSEYKLASGRGAMLDPQDNLYGQAYLVIAELGGMAGRRDDKIFLAAALDAKAFESSLAEQVVEYHEARWNENVGRFEASIQRRWGSIVLTARAMHDIDDAMIKQALLTHIQQKGLSVLPWTDNARQWQARAQFAGRFVGDTPWPSINDESLLHHLCEWLGPYLNGIKNMAALQKIDLESILTAQFDWSQQQRIQRLAPSHIRVPTGRLVPINYCAEQPVLAVKMQEMFGCPESPTLADGRVKILLHLLSPAQRPLAVTADLTSFWQNAYSDVKKDMKGRYPKHYWPDDPLQAVPTSKIKAKMDKP
jgi:ATP-dependent helicase HrpB